MTSLSELVHRLDYPILNHLWITAGRPVDINKLLKPGLENTLRGPTFPASVRRQPRDVPE